MQKRGDIHFASKSLGVILRRFSLTPLLGFLDSRIPGFRVTGHQANWLAGCV